MSMSFKDAYRTINLIRKATIEYGASIVPLLLGETGVGKTELVREYCKDHELSLITIHVSQIEPSDFTGLYKVNRYGRTDNCAPSWLPWLEVENFNQIKATGKATNEELHTLEAGLINPNGGVVFFDEINRGHDDIRQSLYQFILERRMHTFALPANYTIIAAANPSNGGYETYDFDPALINRFAWVDFQPKAKEVTEYLKGKYPDSTMVAWIAHNEELLDINCNYDNTVDSLKKLSSRIVEQAVILKTVMDEQRCDQLFQNNVLRTIMTRDKVEAFLAFDIEANSAIKITDIFEGKWQKATAEYVAKQKVDIISVICSRLARFFTDYEFHSPRTEIENKMVENLLGFFKAIPQDMAVAFLAGANNKYFVTKDGKKYFGKNCKDGTPVINMHHLFREPEFKTGQGTYTEKQFGSILKGAKEIGVHTN